VHAQQHRPGSRPWLARALRLGVGSADIICLIAPAGRLVALECKIDRGVQSDEQIGWQRAVEAVGGHYAVVRSVADARAALADARQSVVSSDNPLSLDLELR